MIDKTLNAIFLAIPSQFCEEREALNMKQALEKKFEMPAKDFIYRQSTIDRAFRTLRRQEVRAMKALFFMQYIDEKKSFDWIALARDVEEYKRGFERALGKDWVYFLKSLIKIVSEQKQPIEIKDTKPRGLLNLVN